ncbi:MAG: endonuclease III [Gammaproteobacteria bacterium TMED78]|nr:MAG: endonuclease III [Gammaproteobacteria bacterium TMED78]
MKRIERAKIVINILNRFYPTTPIPLKHKDTYTLLISVLLSAQCTDKRVNEITPRLFELAPDPISMIKLSQKKIYKIIHPCGLGEKKSKAIYDLSAILKKKYKSKVPNNFKDLENLPGVGHKTASVVMSQGFGIPAFPVDTHIHRLSQRWGLTTGTNVKKTEYDLKKIFPKAFWSKLHLQIIFWGREYCQARSCHGLICEICKKCYPNRKKSFVHS